VRVLVTGGTGALGRAFQAVATAAGHDVLAPGHTELDLFDPPAVAAAVQSVDAVLHLATRIQALDTMQQPGMWRENDRLRAEASAILVADTSVAAGPLGGQLLVEGGRRAARAMSTRSCGSGPASSVIPAAASSADAAQRVRQPGPSSRVRSRRAGQGDRLVPGAAQGLIGITPDQPGAASNRNPRHDERLHPQLAL
jgi:hypothetical protein